MRELFRQAGLDPATVRDPRGPMAWESAVREGRSVGVTTRAAAVSTARGMRLLTLEPPAFLPTELLLPLGDPGALRPAARAFAALARAQRPAGPRG